MFKRLSGWADRNINARRRELRPSFLPPLMIYMAYGVSGLTNIVGTFFVKEYLGLSAEFLAALAFWANIPWVLKMPLGHLVDLLWRWKAMLVVFGAGLIALSFAIMIGLIGSTAFMRSLMPVEVWYVFSVLLLPVGYVIQDVVAEAMTVEAVPKMEADGRPIGDTTLKRMHTTMQTLGRVALVGGNIAIGLINLYLFAGVEAMPVAVKAAVYQKVYAIALIIPAISVLGVGLAGMLRIREARRLYARGFSRTRVREVLDGRNIAPAPNWGLLAGSLLFVVFTVSFGLSGVPYNQEIIFAGSMAIVLFLMNRLLRVLEPQARYVLVGTAVVIFVFRSVPTPGVASTWWMIDRLGFDQHFLAVLSLIGSTLALIGMYLFRRFMAVKSIAYVIGFLTLANSLLNLPTIGMYYGLHEWTAALTGGVVDARFISLIDTALESPLGQVAMIPMLVWIANSAPHGYKATFFAVMASFINLALSLGQLGTKYLNQVFVITREVKDHATGALLAPANYSELGGLLIAANVATFLLPMAAIGFVKMTRLRTA
jgi:hypothetical protein